MNTKIKIEAFNFKMFKLKSKCILINVYYKFTMSIHLYCQLDIIIVTTLLSTKLRKNYQNVLDIIWKIFLTKHRIIQGQHSQHSKD